MPGHSAESLFQWDIDTDNLSLSAGALRLLGLERAPESMAGFMALLPEKTAAELAARRAAVLESGREGSRIESGYLFRGQWLLECLLVLERDRNGRATLALGQLGASPRRPRHTWPWLDAEENSHLQKALGWLRDGHWHWDIRSGQVKYCSRYLDMLGYSAGEFPPTLGSWLARVHPDDRDKAMQAREDVISGQSGDCSECSYRILLANGRWAWIFERGCACARDSAGRALHMAGLITNISTAQQERERLEDLVRHDALTGLRSRAYCDLEIAHIERNGIRPVSVISCDITGLKMVNDALGHAAGDELINLTARLLRQPLRLSDCVGRMGGDEFLVLLPNCPAERGRHLLESIRKSFAEYNGKPDRMPALASFGFATSESIDLGIDEIMAIADEAMLASKKETRKPDHEIIRSWIRRRTGKDVAPDDRVD